MAKEEHTTENSSGGKTLCIFMGTAEKNLILKAGI